MLFDALGPKAEVGFVLANPRISVNLWSSAKANNLHDGRSLFRLFVDQHILLPFAGFFVVAVNAAYPTAWAFLTFKKLLYSSIDRPCTSLFLFRIFNPTNKFVSGDRC